MSKTWEMVVRCRAMKYGGPQRQHEIYLETTPWKFSFLIIFRLSSLLHILLAHIYFQPNFFFQPIYFSNRIFFFSRFIFSTEIFFQPRFFSSRDFFSAEIFKIFKPLTKMIADSAQDCNL